MAELGETEVVEIDLGDRKLQIEQLAGIEQKVQEAIRSPDRTQPFWAVVWPSARALAQVVASVEDLSGKRVIELGCGTGLVGLAAAARGASVILSDLVPESIELALRNAKRNGLEVEGLIMDWSQPPEDLGVFDGICAADVLYDDGMLRGVLRFVRRHLAPEGAAWIADPNRVMRGGLEGASRLHGLRAASLVLQPGSAVIGGVTLYQLSPRG